MVIGQENATVTDRLFYDKRTAEKRDFPRFTVDRDGRQAVRC